MPQAILPNGINIEYDTLGDPKNPTLLWIMGFTAQMTAWPEEFLHLFVKQGFHVVRFDNRDCVNWLDACLHNSRNSSDKRNSSGRGHDRRNLV